MGNWPGIFQGDEDKKFGSIVKSNILSLLIGVAFEDVQLYNRGRIHGSAVRGCYYQSVSNLLGTDDQGVTVITFGAGTAGSGAIGLLYYIKNIM